MQKYSLRKNIKGILILLAFVFCILYTKENLSAKVSLSCKKIIVEKGKRYNVSKLIKGSSKKIKYKTGSNIISVNKKGILKAKKTGTANVRVLIGKKKIKPVIKIKVIDECIRYTVKKKKSVNINTILSANKETADIKSGSYKWMSRNNRIIKVARNSKAIKTGKRGTTYLEGYKKKKMKILLKITVGVPVSKIKLSKSEYVMSVNATEKIQYNILPANADNKDVYYEIEDKDIVEISDAGVIRAKNTGQTMVTVKTEDGHATAQFKVTVNTELVRDTLYGKVEGVVVNNSCVSWLGVPYAKPPVGELRWKAPKEPDTWLGILQTKLKKEKAAQAETKEKAAGSEDCLYLNIFRPNTNEVNLPVLVYLHGGSNISGSSAKNFKHLSSNSNCIVVSVEYRLGAFGWLNVDALKTGNPEEDSGNFALLDIKQSLKWVQDNITYFGGNPNNVTLSGFSAGARNTLAAVISPVMKGLFHKAIIFSGGMTTYKVEDAKKSAIDKMADILVNRKTYSTKNEAKKWIVNATKDEIREFLYGLTTDEVACMYTYMGLKMSNAPQLFADGYVIPKEGFDVIATGNYNAVPMMFGSVSQEFSTYALGANYIDEKVNSEIIKKGWSMLEMIQTAKQYGSMYQSYYYIENNTEKFYAGNAYMPLYAYRFDWGNNSNIVSDFHAKFLGSYHGMDVNFLCGIYKNEYENYVSDLYTDENMQGRKALTDTMQSYIGNFLRNGNPNGYGLATWSAWSPAQTAKLMMFNASKKENTSYMSLMHYSREYIDALVRTVVSTEHADILYRLVFAGRFFMPADENTDIPDEESEGLVELPPDTDDIE